MKKQLISSVALAALAITGTAITSAPTADAARGGCVTQKEFGKVKKNMPKAQVHRIFDTAGKRDAISRGGGYVFEIRSYKSCTRYGAVAVGFENGRMSSKSAVF